MKKLTAFVVTLFLTGTLSLAHARTRALNPQPLPPGMKARNKVQVNPQPLPPGTQSVNSFDSPGSKVELNPQPFPPKAQTSAHGASAIDKVALNPQPLPPGGGAAKLGQGKMAK
jgi:hypothetical protein